MNFHSTDPNQIHFRSVAEAERYGTEHNNSTPEIEAQIAESLRLFRSDQDQAWGNRKVGSHTPQDYREKEETAWRKHQDRLALIAKGKKAKWSLCRACGKEKISAGRKYCAECKRKRRRKR